MRRTTLLASLLGLMGTALSGAVVASPAQAASDPAAGQPAVGRCYQMSRKELNRASYAEEPVDCAGQHTSQVVGVTYLPSGLSWKRASVAKISTIAQRDCSPALWAALGGSTALRAQSAYRLAFFIPSKALRKQGARWIRCDAILGIGKLSPIPASLALTDPLAREVTACLTRRTALVGCGKSHAYRATGVVVLKGGYPSDREFTRKGSKKCAKHITNKKRFYMTWPTKVQWKLGNRTITCYTRTSK